MQKNLKNEARSKRMLDNVKIVSKKWKYGFPKYFPSAKNWKKCPNRQILLCHFVEFCLVNISFSNFSSNFTTQIVYSKIVCENKIYFTEMSNRDILKILPYLYF